MSLKFMGRKRGMATLFDKNGNLVVCTVIEAQPNQITQIKTPDTDGYQAIQLGFEEVITKDPRTKTRRVGKPLSGHFKKSGIEPVRFLQESRIDDTEEYSLGQSINLEYFNDIEFVDITAISKGKGYQGVMKLYNFRGGPAAHGSGFHRHAGSTGMRSDPGRCLPGGKRASQMGNRKTTVQNLKVVKIDTESNLIIIKGQVPGPKNGLVTIKKAIKKKHK